MITNIRNTTSVNEITTINNIKGKKKINLSWLFKFLKLSQEIPSLFVSTYTSFPLSISWIGVIVTDSVRTREEWMPQLAYHSGKLTGGEWYTNSRENNPERNNPWQQYY